MNLLLVLAFSLLAKNPLTPSQKPFPETMKKMVERIPPQILADQICEARKTLKENDLDYVHDNTKEFLSYAEPAYRRKTGRNVPAELCKSEHDINSKEMTEFDPEKGPPANQTAAELQRDACMKVAERKQWVNITHQLVKSKSLPANMMGQAKKEYADRLKEIDRDIAGYKTRFKKFGKGDMDLSKCDSLVPTPP